MISLHKKTNTLCFDHDDLKVLFETPFKSQLAEELLKSVHSSEELLGDKDKM